MRNRATIVVLAVVLLCGCATTWQAMQSDERAQYMGVQRTFTATVNILADLRAAGTFDVETADQITEVIKGGRLALEAWADSLRHGGSDTGAKGTALKALQTLAAYQSQGDGP